MNTEKIEKIDGVVVTPEERIAELESEIYNMRGGGGLSPSVVKLLANPSQIKGLLQLNDEQATNIKAIISGAGAAFFNKHFGKSIGDEFSAAAGGFLAAWISKKILG